MRAGWRSQARRGEAEWDQQHVTRLRGLVLDVSPLRQSRQFRLLFWGQSASQLGRQFTVVAAAYQVYALTGSTLLVGLLSLGQLVPLLLCSLIGGSLADAMDRRRLLLVVQVLMALTSAGLAVNSVSGHPAVWPIFVCTAISAALSAIDSPTRSAMVPGLVSAGKFPAAAALNQILNQGSGAVGPLVAGLVIAKMGLGVAYWIDVASFGVALATLVMMAPALPVGGTTKLGFESVAEGFRFLRGRQALQGTFVIDVNAMVFGMPRALFPEMAARTFGGGALVYGALNSAAGIGALLGAASSGWVTRVRRQGRAVLLAVAAWGLAIVLFGVTSWLPLALFMLAVAGAADVISAVFRNTILQLSVPDRLRGRLSAVHIAVVTGGPRLGDVESGAVASLAGTQVSAVSGGLACLVGVGLIAKLMPALGRWTPDDRVTEPGERPAGHPVADVVVVDEPA